MHRPRALITLAEFRRRLGGIARSTDNRLRASDPDYPELVQITPGLYGVLEAAADIYIASRPRIAPPEPKAATAALRAKRASKREPVE
jgi:hypothetical protein